MESDSLEKMRFEEWKYRHGLTYSLMFRYISVVFALLGFAVVQANVFCDHEISPHYLSLVAIFIGLTAIIHVATEFSRTVEARLQLHISDQSTEDKLLLNFPKYHFIKKRLNYGWLFWGLQLFIYVTVPALIYSVSVNACAIAP
jgi:hypothetical protein